MEQTLGFDDAVQRFRVFIRDQGWPEAMVWRSTDDVLLLPGPTMVVRVRDNGCTDEWARRFYDEGACVPAGIELHAACRVNGQTCCTVFWTRDPRTAELMMLPVTGLKLSCSTQPIDAALIGPVGWWLTKRALNKFHARLQK